MEDQLAALEQAFLDYRQDLKNCLKKSRLTDGLLGFGHSLKDDSCHDRFDEHVQQAVQEICASDPTPETAEKAVRRLLLPEGDPAQNWPLAAEWMLGAIERHSLPLIPFLPKEAAADILQSYAGRYKPWNRLPVQKDIIKALKNHV